MSVNQNDPFISVNAGVVVTTDTRLTAPVVSQYANSAVLGRVIRTGTSVPNWRNILAKGGDASSSYTRSGLVSVTNCMLAYEGTTGNRYMPTYRVSTSARYATSGSPKVLYNNDVETQNRALAKFKKQLSSRVGSYQSMAPIAECRELARLVEQGALYSVEFCKAVLEAKRTKGKSVWRYMQNYWLAFNFGLAPMIKDIDGIGQSISAYLSRSDLQTRLSATATKNGLYTYDAGSPVSVLPFNTGIIGVGEAAYKLSYRYVGAYALKVKSSNNWSIFDQLGLGWSSIPAAAWELTAFSWLFDYFMNVGQFLEDAFVSPPGNTSYLVMDRRYELTAQNTYSFTKPPKDGSWLDLKSVGGKSDFKYVEFVRTPLSSLPHIGLYVKSQDSIASYGVSKLLNLLAVLK